MLPSLPSLRRPQTAAAGQPRFAASATATMAQQAPSADAFVRSPRFSGDIQPVERKLVTLDDLADGPAKDKLTAAIDRFDDLLRTHTLSAVRQLRILGKHFQQSYPGYNHTERQNTRFLATE